MTLRQYLVKVHCCGSRWLIEVPAVVCWTPVDDKKTIVATARQMISAITGVALDSFGIDLTEDRVLASIEEYAVGATVLRRWEVSADIAEPS